MIPLLLIEEVSRIFSSARRCCRFSAQRGNVAGFELSEERELSRVLSSARRCCGLEFSKEVSRDLKLAGIVCFEPSEDDCVAGFKLKPGGVAGFELSDSARRCSGF